MNGPIRSFSPTYLPDELTGYAASHHPERADRFQQLVGALLLQQYQNDAHLSTTRGRDGSIDAYVESPHAPKAGLCAGLATPIIVECKDHETGANTFNNVLQGWARMEEKLLRQERDGWAGHFRPWLRSRSYVYCVSAQLTPSQRDDLRGRIQTFLFQTLPQPSQLPITEVRLVDWNDLRDQLNRCGRLIDAWLGIRHTNIAAHQELLHGFSGFRTLLRQDTLDFIELDADSAFNPRRLYARLDHADGPTGVVLVGAGGIGKSRTAIEVASLAEQDGWRVLHIQPGEPAVSCEDIETVLSIDNHRTLLVFDYLEQATLDFPSLTHRVLGAAHARGQRVRLLGTARPSTLRPHPARDALFERVEMSIDGDQQARLSQQLVRSVAPTAIAMLGPEAIIASCGHRPIIAVIIARDLERLAQGKQLTLDHLRLSPPGDLLARLRAQLDSQRLVANTNRSGGLVRDPPKPDLIVAATLLAATPYDEASLAETVSRAFAGDDPVGRSRRILAHLRTLGWIDSMGGMLYSAHDVVADELLQRVFWDADSQALEVPEFHHLLTPLLDSARLLGRFSVAFSRLQPGPFRETISAESARWLATHAQALGDCWAQASTDESAYALGATLDYPDWAEQLIRHWDVFIQPWLERHGDQLAARHLLYRGLKALPGSAGRSLMATAEQWLQLHHLRIEAGFVLAPLLERDDLGTLAPTVITYAVDWLKHEDRAGNVEAAGFVLGALMGRSDLDVHAAATIGLAISWLNRDGGDRITRSTGFVLKPLLERDDLGADASAVIALAMRGLGLEGHTHTAEQAQFILAPLLERDDLGTHAPAAVELAMTWLSHENRASADDEARFLLAAMLERADLGVHAAAIIAIAMAWLQHGDRARSLDSAGFVFDPLLKRPDLGTHAADANQLALTWLKHEDRALASDAAMFVLAPLLGRDDLDTCAATAIDLAMRWLSHEERARHIQPAQFVLARLLERDDLGAQAPAAISLAMDWLSHEDRARSAGAAEYILVRLLERDELTEQQRAQTRDHAIEWLSLFPDSDECTYSLKALLVDRHSRSGEKRVFEVALLWLKNRHTEADVEFVLKRLLRQRTLDDEQWRQTVGYACNWLSCHSSHKEYPFLLADTLLRAHCLTDEQRQLLLHEAGALLAGPSRLPQGIFDVLHMRLQAVKSGTPLQLVNPLVEELTQLASGIGAADTSKVQQGLDAAQQYLEKDRPANAGFYVPPLLALSHRADDAALRQVILALATATVRHPGMGPLNLRGMRKSALRLLEANAWPTQQSARDDLVAVGLLDPADIRESETTDQPS